MEKPAISQPHSNDHCDLEIFLDIEENQKLNERTGI